MRSLVAKNSIERLGGEYDLESKFSAFFCTPEQESTNKRPKHLQMWCYFGVRGGGVFQ